MRKALVRALVVLALGTPAVVDAQQSAYGCEFDLKSLYEEMLDTLDIPHRDLLERAQQAWADYRDARCELIAERTGYPEVAAGALETCRAYMARERTAELRLIRLSLPAP